MLSAFSNIFKIPELRNRIFFTIGIIAAIRLGSYIPTPGVDPDILAEFFKRLQSSAGGSLFGIMNMFTGGAMSRATITALGIMPYISASIIIQLLTVVVPALEKMARDQESGRQKIMNLTRYGTLGLSMFQAFFISLWLENPASFQGMEVVPFPGWMFRITCVLTLTTGTMLLMWLGEQVSERGIGNGISLVITVGIVSRIPSVCRELYTLMTTSVEQGGRGPLFLIGMLAIMAVVIAAIIVLTHGERKIPVQYAKRMVGRKMYGGQNTFIPLKVNYGGVIPIIFASSLLLFPATIGSMVKSSFISNFSSWLAPGTAPYSVAYVMLIIFFCYFWTATQFNPIQWAQDMKRNGAFVPGIRPGQFTADFLASVMARVTLIGAVFLSVIAIIPTVINSQLKVSYQVASFLGGTGLLIIVGVMLDTMKQIESHLLNRHYDGFMTKGKLKGRNR